MSESPFPGHRVFSFFLKKKPSNIRGSAANVWGTLQVLRWDPGTLTKSLSSPLGQGWRIVWIAVRHFCTQHVAWIHRPCLGGNSAMSNSTTIAEHILFDTHKQQNNDANFQISWGKCVSQTVAVSTSSVNTWPTNPWANDALLGSQLLPAWKSTNRKRN